MCRFFLSAFFLFISALFCFASAAPGNGLIQGVVTDGEGNPVVKAHVELISTIIGAVTDKRGEFILKRVPEGVYSLRITHISYTKKVISPVVVRKKSAVKLGIIKLKINVLQSPGISVTATRSTNEITDVSKAVNLIPEIVISERNSKTTAEVLREEPGVFVQKTSHGGGSAIIRGLSSNQILLMVDGIRLNNSTYRLGNHSYLTMIDYFSLEQLEVVRGPASVLYGSDALGGAVNAITKERISGNNKAGFNYRVFGRAATADKERTSRVEMSYISEKIGMVGGLSFKRFGDLRRGTNNSVPELEHSLNGPVQTPSGFDCFDYDYKLITYPSRTTKLTLATQYTKKSNLPRYDKYENSGYFKWLYNPQIRHLTYLKLNKSLNNRYVSSMEITLSLNNQKEGREKQKKPESSITRESVDVKTGGFTLQLRSFIRGHFLTYGSEVYHDLVSSERSRQDPVTLELTKDKQARYPDGATYTSFGAYIQDEFNISRRFKTIAGVRWSMFSTEFSLPESSPVSTIFGKNISQTFKSFTGSAGLVYKLKDDIYLDCNIGQAFRAPNLSDISKLGESKGDVFEIPNPSLEPETMSSIDAGLKIENERISFAASVYYARINNLIASADALYNGESTIEVNSSVFKVKSKQNIGTAYLCGLETAFNYQTGRWDIFSNVTFPYGWNITQHEPVGGVPPLFGLAGVKLLFKKGYAESFIRFALKQDKLCADDLDDPRIPAGGTPGWNTFNFRTVFPFTSYLTAVFELGNIFDVNYREHGSGINGPGRNFILSLEVKR